jgi:APA family basic amino acid/polyamine antiporter
VPPSAAPGFPVQPFAVGLFFIAFAYSGWNAAIYAAEEFREPKRDVARAMAIGCGLVAVLYMVVNWVFVANLTPERARVVFEYETARITLGHLIATDVLGPAGGRAMSVLAVFSFLSAMSAMIFAGPRVYAAMARDGFLPAALRGRAGRPPSGSVWFQGIVTVLLLQAQSLREILANVGAILTLIAALTVLTVFRLRGRANVTAPPDLLSRACAALYVVAAAWMLYHGVSRSPSVLLWLAIIAGATLLGYFSTHILNPKRSLQAAERGRE